MRFIEHIFLFMNLLNLFISIVPTWNFQNSAVELLSSDKNSHEFLTDGNNCKIKKIITKNNDNGEITYEK